MSIFPKKHHGDELKCGGPQMCSDCREQAKKDTFFGIDYGSWKTKKIYICQSGNQLWIALTSMQLLSSCDHGPTREDRMKAIKLCPYPPHPTCKCADCRYHRLVSKNK